MIVTRTQKIRIKPSSPYWEQIDKYAWQTKNLYNLANYIVRQEFIKTSKEKEEGLRDNANWIRYNELDKLCQQTEPYKAVGSQSAQATLRRLDKNWKSFMKSIKDYMKNPAKYTGRPKLPKYLNKESGRYVIGIKNNQVKNKDGHVYFSWQPFKSMNNKFKTLRQERIYSARIIPRLPDYILEIVYEVEVPDARENATRIVGIDLGIDNLLTVVSNCGVEPIVINGKPAKGMNAYYNRKKADIQSKLMLQTGKYNSHRITSLTKKRNAKIEDYIHKASRRVVDWCIKNDIDTVVCGHNKGWKQESNIGKRNNQNFISIPHTDLIHKLQYKCEDAGIKFVEVEEGYTSGTSFLDSEEPIKDNYDKSRRVTRGLFVSNEGIEINADVNGAYQIIRKAFPNAFANGIQGVGLHPVIVNL